MDALVDATSGGIASVVAALLVYPLDTVLVRYQASTSKIRGERSLTAVTAEVLRKGISGIYQGVEAKLTQSFVMNFLFFYWYQTGKQLWKKRFHSISGPSYLAIATCAAVLNQCITAPFDIVTTHIQTTDKSLKDVFADILKDSGPRGFYRGFGASLLLCCNPAITNSVFDRLKIARQYLVRQMKSQDGHDNDDDEEIWGKSTGSNSRRSYRYDSNTTDDVKETEISAIQLFVIGAIAKGVATFVTYPYIRSKILVQARAARRVGQKAITRHSSNTAAIKELGESDGEEDISPTEMQGDTDKLMTRMSSSNEVSDERMLANSALRRYVVRDQIETPETQSFETLSPSHNVTDKGRGSSQFSNNLSTYCRIASWQDDDFRKHVDPLKGDQDRYGDDVKRYSPSKLLAAMPSLTHRKGCHLNLFPKSLFCDSHDDDEREMKTPHAARFSNPNYSSAENSMAIQIPPPRRVRSEASLADSDKGVTATLVSTIMNEGVSGLYRGLALQLFKTVLSAAVMYSIKGKAESSTEKVLRGFTSFVSRLVRYERRRLDRLFADEYS